MKKKLEDLMDINAIYYERNILKAVLQKRNDQIIYTLGKHTHTCEEKEKK